MRVNIELDQAAVNEVQKKLVEIGQEKVTGRVMQKAINQAATAGKNMLHSKTKAMYTIKPAEFKKDDIVKESATVRHMQATISVKGRTPGVRKAYKTKKNTKRKAAAAQILKSGTTKELELRAGEKNYKAFVVKMKNGHEGVFQRVPGKKMRKKTHKEAIKEMMAMSKAKAAEAVYKKENMQKELQEELQAGLTKHMEAVIGGLK